MNVNKANKFAIFIIIVIAGCFLKKYNPELHDFLFFVTVFFVAMAILKEIEEKLYCLDANIDDLHLEIEDLKKDIYNR